MTKMTEPTGIGCPHTIIRENGETRAVFSEAEWMERVWLRLLGSYLATADQPRMKLTVLRVDAPNRTLVLGGDTASLSAGKGLFFYDDRGRES